MDDKKLKLLVKHLAGDGALAWAWKKDDSLVVIERSGEKRHYSAEVCRKALKKLETKIRKKTDEQAG
ncbi:MAG TPA: hypothetical protein PK459_01410 [Anaerolineaceae bacterium]|nr:hypothetical protein [Anaerolineaceae bacterium]